MNAPADFIVVGGGLVGLATAYQLGRLYPDCRIILLEKEAQVGQHQSGRNSGVLHSGVYYKPGSLKAVTCRTGKQMMEAFCQEEKIPWERCGKVIVAVDPSEIDSLDRIAARGKENGVACETIDPHQLKQIEPHAHGVQALHVPEAGIVDYPAVCIRLRDKLRQAGHRISVSQQVQSILCQRGGIEVRTSDQRYSGGYLITCGGLHSDRLVRLSGLEPQAKIVPFRGEYYELVPDRQSLCRNLIYPVPDPKFPFLGVHFTRMAAGGVECGPNAVLALAREGYNWSTVRLADLAESLSYPGFLKLAGRHWKMGLGEIHRSLSKAAFVRALQRLVPEIRSGDLVPCRSGVRAQALARDGSLIDDFLWVTAPRMLHVCNAPSPAATASLEIGRLIADKAGAAA